MVTGPRNAHKKVIVVVVVETLDVTIEEAEKIVEDVMIEDEMIEEVEKIVEDVMTEDEMTEANSIEETIAIVIIVLEMTETELVKYVVMISVVQIIEELKFDETTLIMIVLEMIDLVILTDEETITLTVVEIILTLLLKTLVITTPHSTEMNLVLVQSDETEDVLTDTLLILTSELLQVDTILLEELLLLAMEWTMTLIARIIKCSN